MNPFYLPNLRFLWPIKVLNNCSRTFKVYFHLLYCLKYACMKAHTNMSLTSVYVRQYLKLLYLNQWPKLINIFRDRFLLKAIYEFISCVAHVFTEKTYRCVFPSNFKFPFSLVSFTQNRTTLHETMETSVNHKSSAKSNLEILIAL